MIRISTVCLFLLLIGAAAGRYQAETAVRDADREIRELKLMRAAKERNIQVLRTEIALLEGPDRLAELADKYTGLEPLSGAQLMTAEDFLLAFGGGAALGADDDHTFTEDVARRGRPVTAQASPQATTSSQTVAAATSSAY